MKQAIMTSISVLALSAAGALAAPAYGQSAAEVLTRDVITVTATKQPDAENVQDVPLAVTAFGIDQLDALKVRDLQSLTTSIPNVALDDVGTTAGTANFSIRGLGINSSIPSIDPTVGVFVDGMYLGINNGVVFDIFDLESIEVLRGPQGILFGRNVTGGAVLINTRRPGDEFEAELRTAVEGGFNDGGANFYLMGAVGGPVSDTVSMRLAAYWNDDQGYFQRYLGGPTPFAVAEAAFTPAGAAVVAPGGPAPDAFEDFGQSETFLVRPSLLWTPNDRAELLIKFEHGTSEGDGPPAQNHINGSGVANSFYSADRDGFDFSIDEVGFYDSEWNQLIVEGSLDVGFGNGTITNLFGWRDYSSETLADIDATPLHLFHAGTVTTQDQFSNELRYNGTFGDRYTVTTGLYYFTQDIAYTETRDIPLQLLAGASPFFSGGGVQEQTTYGVFGQLDVEISDQLTINLGARYTDENKEVVISNLLFTRTPCSVETAGDCSEDFVDEDSWSNFTPKIGFEYAASETMNVYGHWTQGVRSGGYNFRNASLAFPPGPFDEETVDAFEVGLKTEIADGRGTLNLAAFYTEIEDMQREVLLADPVVGSVQIVRNTASAALAGVELEGNLAVTDSFVLTGSLGYTDGEYEDVQFDLNGDGVVNGVDEGLEIPRLAPWTFSIGGVHSFQLDNGYIINTRVNYSYRDEAFFTDNNLGRLNELNILDASMALNLPNGVAVSVYGQNLLDEVNFGGDAQLPASLGGGTFSPLMKGRIIGIELQWRR